MARKFILFVICTTLAITSGAALATTRPSDYVSANAYNNLYPYMNNTMRTNLNPGVSPSQANAQINVLTRTNTTNSSTRTVVPRRATTTNTNARAATTSSARTTPTSNTAAQNARSATRGVSQRRATSTGTSTARAATNGDRTTARRATSSLSAQSASGTRRVIARAGTSTGTTAMQTGIMRTSRADGNVSTARQSSTAVYTSTGEAVSSARCMADYVDCMNSYCQRENTEYNRCYCSAQLAQIDAKYKPEIDRLIKEILTLQNKSHWTEDEMNEYWMETIGKYTGDNSWENLDDALNIDWSSTESQVRGQQAFAIGHQYCVQHLTGCAYMQTNMRDAYRSDIARDCAAYENSLQQLQNVAESVVEAYK